MTFLAEFVRHPMRTGALGSTTRACARAFLADLALEKAQRVVELGAGTGAITAALRQRLPPGAEILAIEVSPAMARLSMRRWASGNVEVVCASALDLRELLSERKVTAADYVISTLPFTVMPTEDQSRILRAVCDVLHGGGRFSTMLAAHRARTHAGRRFEELLRKHFAVVERGSTLWTNVPPLRPYHCRQG